MCVFVSKNGVNDYRFFWHKNYAVLLALLCLACATEDSVPSLEQRTVPAETGQSAGIEKKTEAAAPEIPKEQAETPAIADPLEEVARLWREGKITKARNRFVQDDVTALSGGPRRSEWSVWRGRLFVSRWTKDDLGLSGANISAVLADGDDIWAGTWTGGLIRYSVPLGTVDVWDPGEPSLAVRTVNRILRHGAFIWIVRYGSLERYNLRSSLWSAETDFPVSERLQDLVFAGSQPYVATLGSGLWTKDGQQWIQLSSPSRFINRLYLNADGAILTATMDQGLFVYNPSDQSWKAAPSGPLRDSNITAVLQHEDEILCGTYGSGGYIWNTATSQVRKFSEDRWIMALEQFGNRYCWGSLGAGIGTLSADLVHDRLNVSEGLPSGDIVALDTDPGGSLWAGTLGGGLISVAAAVYGGES